MAILQNPENVAQAEALDLWILEARSLLAAMGSDNVVAVEATRCIDALRRKIAAAAPPETRLGLILPRDESATTPIPYLGAAVDPSAAPLPSPYAPPGSLDARADSATSGFGFDLSGLATGEEWDSRDWPLPLASMHLLDGTTGWDGFLEGFEHTGVPVDGLGK
ncbi:putative meiotically up-regulated protein [Pseudohyphozyma bogoriensis]|nr:putative meiotically up-regulated protein [Pseudohyphozyma bogoriensis]